MPTLSYAVYDLRSELVGLAAAYSSFPRIQVRLAEQAISIACYDPDRLAEEEVSIAFLRLISELVEDDASLSDTVPISRRPPALK